jgi:hypothetical protein
MTVQMNIRLLENDHTALRIKSAIEKRDISDILQEVFMEVLSGKISIPDEQPTVATTTFLDEEVKERIALFAKGKGMTTTKLLREALRIKLANFRLP